MQYRQRPRPARARCDELRGTRRELQSTRMNALAGQRAQSRGPHLLERPLSMKTFACLVIAALLTACAAPASQEPGPAPDPGAPAAGAVLPPNSNLIVQGIPPIPLSVVEQ